MSKIVTALVSLFTLITLVQAAETLPITPGLWEIKGTSTDPFSGSKSFTTRECMTEDGIGPDMMMKDMPKDACDVNSSVSGNTISYEINCSMQGQQMTGGGSFTINGDTAEGEMTLRSSISGQEFEISTVSSGKRVGDC